jgi:gamma-glutamyl:cysteine ligase YbdK (ATP-grasp superfamily)
MSEFKDFLGRFSFDPRYRGWRGVEREHFLVDRTGRPVPRAAEFLRNMRDPQWTYELSACQVEDRTPPAGSKEGLRMHLRLHESRGKRVAGHLGLLLKDLEVGPEDMTLETYPDPRYASITERISEEVLCAACRVAGTHIHLGAGSMEEALEFYGALRPHLSRFMTLGDHSAGERLALYRQMAPAWEPPAYASPEEFFEAARSEGFAENPRDCWHIIRVSRHGTVELRMFGATHDLEEIIGWTEEALAAIGVPA